MSTQHELKSSANASGGVRYEPGVTHDDESRVREFGHQSLDRSRMDLDVWSEAITKAFHRGVARAIEENVRLFGRAEGPDPIEKS